MPTQVKRLLPLLVACTQPPAPHVQIIAPDYVVEHAILGARAWDQLGFVTDVVPSGLPECDRPWIDGHEPCQVTLRFVNVPGMYDTDTGDGHVVGHADRDNGIITFDGEYLDDRKLLHTLAHESGHILLNCGHLNPATEHGIMAWGLVDTEWLTVPTQDDYNLACKEVGLCL